MTDNAMDRQVSARHLVWAPQRAMASGGRNEDPEMQLAQLAPPRTVRGWIADCGDQHPHSRLKCVLLTRSPHHKPGQRPRKRPDAFSPLPSNPKNAGMTIAIAQ